MKVSDLNSIAFCENCGSPLVVPSGLCGKCSYQNGSCDFVPEDLAVLGDKYTLVQLIARGGMGSVYKIFHNALGEHRALKTIKNADGIDKATRDRFMREAKIAANIESDYLVDLYDFGVDENATLYMILEYVDGVNLIQFLERNRNLPVSGRLELFRQVLMGVSVLHDQDIVHRDISLENVMVVQKSDGTTLKIIDLGLSRSISTPEVEITDRKMFFGKFFYSAPEYFSTDLYREDRPFSVDVYSLGVLGYYLLTHRFPFHSHNPKELVNQHVFAAPEPILLPEDRAVETEVSALVLKALAKDPTERYVSARAFLEELEHWLDRHQLRVSKDAFQGLLQQYNMTSQFRQQLRDDKLADLLALFSTRDALQKHFDELYKALVYTRDMDFIYEKHKEVKVAYASDHPASPHALLIALSNMFIDEGYEEFKNILDQFSIYQHEYNLLVELEYLESRRDYASIQNLCSTYKFVTPYRNKAARIAEGAQVAHPRSMEDRRILVEEIQQLDAEAVQAKFGMILERHGYDKAFLREYLDTLISKRFHEQQLAQIQDIEAHIARYRYTEAQAVLNGFDLADISDSGIMNRIVKSQEDIIAGQKMLEEVQAAEKEIQNGFYLKARLILEPYAQCEDGHPSRALYEAHKVRMDGQLADYSELCRAHEAALGQYDVVKATKLLQALERMHPPEEKMGPYRRQLEQRKDLYDQYLAVERLYMDGRYTEANALVTKLAQAFPDYQRLADLNGMIQEEIEKKVAKISGLEDKILNGRYAELYDLYLQAAEEDKAQIADIIACRFPREALIGIGDAVKKLIAEDKLELAGWLCDMALKADPQGTGMANLKKYIGNIGKISEDIWAGIHEVLDSEEIRRTPKLQKLVSTLEVLVKNKKYDSAIIILKTYIKKNESSAMLVRLSDGISRILSLSKHPQ